MAKQSGWDVDFAFGREGESLVEELLTDGKKVEVKRDRKWHITGNLYIEVECWYNRTQSWEASGIMVTQAEYWAFVLERGVLLVPTSHVKYAIKEFGREITCEIPPNRSKGYLITVEDLLTAMRKLKND